MLGDTVRALAAILVVAGLIVQIVVGLSPLGRAV
jgi:hypothetical protein